MDLARQWYALCCKPRKEHLIWQQLASRGYEVFYPHILKMTKNGKRFLVKPFFPGYVFVNLDFEEESASKLQWMQHSTGLVCIDGKPFHIPDGMIAAMQNRLYEINSAIRTPLWVDETADYQKAAEDNVNFRELIQHFYEDDDLASAIKEMFTKISASLEKGNCLSA
jgi:transcription antitermination factor NusG